MFFLKNGIEISEGIFHKNFNSLAGHVSNVGGTYYISELINLVLNPAYIVDQHVIKWAQENDLMNNSGILYEATKNILHSIDLSCQFSGSEFSINIEEGTLACPLLGCTESHGIEGHFDQ